MRIGVKFPGSSKVYCYRAPADTKVGDVVLVPANFYTPHESYAKVTTLAPSYTGVTKAVRAVYRQHISKPTQVERDIERAQCQIRQLQQTINHLRANATMDDDDICF